MEKIVINLETSITRLSDEALMMLSEREGMRLDGLKYINFAEQWQPCLHYGTIVDIVEELGERANGNFACLTIIEVPDHYVGSIEDRPGGGEMVKFEWQEDYLRELIRAGNEDDIVKYIKGKLY